MSGPLLVVGEALVDVVEHADGGRTEHPGGSPLNVAVAAARLGTGVVLATQFGNDAHGRLVREHVAHSGVSLESLAPSRRTGTATARLAAGGSATYDFDLAWDPDVLPPPRDVAAVHAGSIGVTLAPGADRVLELLEWADAAGVPVSLDPNLRPAITPDLTDVRRRVDRAVAHAWAVKLSDEDAAVLRPGRSAKTVVDELLSAGVGLVALTRGRGPVLLASSRARVEVTPPAVMVVDTIGAGDAFMGAVLAACATNGWLGRGDLDGDELAGLGRVAVTAAAITCSRPGADPPWATELGGPGANACWAGVAPDR